MRLFSVLAVLALSAPSHAALKETIRCQLTRQVDAPTYHVFADTADRTRSVVKKSGSEIGTYKATPRPSGNILTYEFTDEYGTFWLIWAADGRHELRRVTSKTTSVLVSDLKCQTFR